MLFLTKLNERLLGKEDVGCPSIDAIKENKDKYHFFSYSSFSKDLPNEFKEVEKVTSNGPKVLYLTGDEVKCKENKNVTFDDIIQITYSYFKEKHYFDPLYSNCQLDATALFNHINDKKVNGVDVKFSNYNTTRKVRVKRLKNKISINISIK